MKNFFTAPGILRIALVAAISCTPSENDGSPPENTRRVTFETTSGTWMTVDVSPDGKSVLFDLIGNIYELPISGGRAKQLTSGWTYQRAPRYSPDGKQISMVRDAEGPDEVWVMPASGGEPQRLTDHSRQELGWVRGTPSWAPDGKSIIFGADSSTWLTDLRRLDVSDKTITVLEKNPPSGDRRTGILSPDGSWLYYTDRASAPPGRAGRSISIMLITQINLSTGARKIITDSSKLIHEFTPQISRDGRLLAFIRRDSMQRSALRIVEIDKSGNVVVGSDRALMELPDEDSPHRFDDTDARPGYAFTPDGQFIVISTGGKIHKVSVADGRDTVIEFTATVDREVWPRAVANVTLADGPVEVREIQWPRLTPDGKTLVFAAVGYLWSQSLPNGKPERVTTAGDGEFEVMPALSPDGKTIAYVSMGRDGFMPTPGKLMTVPLSGGEGRVVLGEKTTAMMPAWSPDGSKIAFVRVRHTTIRPKYLPGSATCAWVSANGGRPIAVDSAGFRDSNREFSQFYERVLSFSKDAKSIWCGATTGDGFTWKEVPVDGGTVRERLTAGEGTLGVIPSPDGRHALVTGRDWELRLISLPSDSATVKTDFADTALKRITSTGADYASWSDDTTVIYSFRNRIYRYIAGRGEPQLFHTVELTYPRRGSNGITAFVNGRIVTMSGDSGPGEVIEKGTLVVRGRRIEAVGPSDQVTLPEGAKIVDVAGMTLMPTLTDVHWHPDWGQELGYLDSPHGPAYGITTVWIPSNPPWNRGFLPIHELQQTGRIDGPRWFDAGPVISITSNGDPPPQMIANYDDAHRVVKHHADYGAVAMKEYLTRSRGVRRWFAQAARATGIGIVSHTQALDQVVKDGIDGYTGVDHNTFAVPVYDDLRQFLAKTRLIWTPNLFATGWGIEHGGFERREYIGDVLQRLPDQRDKWTTYYGETRELDQRYSFESTMPGRVTNLAKAAAYLINGGAKVANSYHNPPGLMVHGEMWFLQNGGAAPGDALRAATRNGIEKIGLIRDLGSLEKGKIADFLVLKANPLDGVVNALAQKYVVQDGVILEVEKGWRHQPVTARR
jgi:Tol biopolymer transport system component